MKNKAKVLLTIMLTVSTVMTGCSLKDTKDAQKADEYLTDSSAESSTTEDANAEQSTVVIKDLFEPAIDTNDTAEVTDAATEATSIDRDQTVEIVFFGDSQIANGRDESTDIPTLLSQRVPNCKCYNLAIGGTTASLEKSTSSISPADIKSQSFVGMVYALTGQSNRDETLAGYPGILNTMNSIDTENVDYYIIEYGANDFFSEVPMENSLYDTDQLHSYYNALSTGIENLKNASPNATFILMTPFYGIYRNASDGTYIGDSYIVSNGYGTLADYAHKVEFLAGEKGAIYFDGMFKTKCDLYLDTAGEYLSDNLHLTLTGRQIFSRLLAHYINFQEHNEPYAYLETDFINIADFDPDEYYRYDEGQMKMYFPESWEKYIKGEFPLAQPSEEALSWGD